MKPEDLIKCINKSCKKSINPAFNLSPTDSNPKLRHFIIDGRSCAVNNREEKVKVLKWFDLESSDLERSDTFWLFLEIKFGYIGNKNETEINISLSVFQGEDKIDEKYQLFRAEWDDYNNPDEKHAQPHWHITSNQANENTFEEHVSVSSESEFVRDFGNEKQKVLDVKKIHFAMNADWQQEKGDYIHKVEDEQQIVRWLQGMLNYIRTEIEYLYSAF